MAGRNHSKLRPSYERIEDSVTLHPPRRYTPTEVHIIEDRIAAQSREIQTFIQENQRLAATHVALKNDVAASQQDFRRLSQIASSIKAEKDAQVREVYERALKLEAEARSVDGLSAELDRVRAEIKELRDERKELSEKLKDIEGDISSTQPELQEFSDLKTEIEAWQKEIRKGRAAIDYERKMHSINFELSEAMEKHMISIVRDAEKLRTELANAGQRATTAVAGPGYAIQQPGYAIQQPGYAIQQPGYAIQQPGYATQQPGYAIQQSGYGGNSLSDPHAVQPGYAIQQPGYGANSLSDPHAVQPGHGGNTLSGPHAVRPGYGGNTLNVPHVVQPGYAIQQPRYGANSLADPHVVQPGYAIQQPGYGANSLADPHAVQPGYAIQQPGYGGNSLSDPHAVQPGHGGNTTLSDPHAVHQGDHSKKRKAESKPSKKKRKSESKPSKRKGKAEGGKIPKCANCEKNHRGECLKGKKACFKCKEPGHLSYDCTAFKEKKLVKKGKAEVIASTLEEVEHVMTG